MYINLWKVKEFPGKTLSVGNSQYCESIFGITNRAGISDSENVYNLGYT